MLQGNKEILLLPAYMHNLDIILLKLNNNLDIILLKVMV